MSKDKKEDNTDSKPDKKSINKNNFTAICSFMLHLTSLQRFQKYYYYKPNKRAYSD